MSADARGSLEEVSVRVFRENLSSFLQKARRGERFVVTSHGAPVAQFGPPTVVEARSRPFGLLRGRIHIAPDFDRTPDEVIAAMEDGETPGSGR